MTAGPRPGPSFDSRAGRTSGAPAGPPPGRASDPAPPDERTTGRRWWRDLSLRGKLIAACVTVPGVVMLALLWSATTLLEDTLAAQAQTHARQVVSLLQQSIAAPMSQRDYATLQQSLDLLRADQTLDYLVLRDHRGRVVTTSGLAPGGDDRLPPRDGPRPDLKRPDKTWHLGSELVVAGLRLGRIDFGISTEDLRQARQGFVRQAVVMSGIALVVTMAAMAGIAHGIARRLGSLLEASKQVSLGRFDIHLPTDDLDEIGALAESFRAMTATLAERVHALQASELRQRELFEAARREEIRLTALLGAMEQGIVFIDADARVLYANEAFARIWQIERPPAGTDARLLVDAFVAKTATGRASALRSSLAADLVAWPAEAPSGADAELQREDGSLVLHRSRRIAESPGRAGHIWIHEDVTAERAVQLQARQALHDPLTGLLNRRGLLEALARALAQARRDGKPVTLLFIDLDDFKQANDVGGHQAGDEILVMVARTLTRLMRRDEVAGRLGGDEFAVACVGLGTAEATAVAERLVEAISSQRLAPPLPSLGVGSSIGIANYPQDASNAEDLLRCADLAMYQAKRQGKNRVALHSSVADAPPAAALRPSAVG